MLTPWKEIYEKPSEVKVKSLSRVWLFVTPWTVASRLLCPWDYLGKNIGVNCHFLLQGIFLTQESNPGLPRCRQMLYRLSHQGSSLLKSRVITLQTKIHIVKAMVFPVVMYRYELNIKEC